MKTELYLQIPKPCHENWDAMTPVDQGKFCASCSKEVVDFSLMSDVDVLNFFKRSTGNTCGRFDSEQLQRPLQETKIEKKKGWRWAMASMASLIMITKSNAQKKENCGLVLGKVAPQKEVVQKKVVTQKKITLPGIMGEPVFKAGPPKVQTPAQVVIGAAVLIIPDGKIKIKGIVVDEENKPIPNAMIRMAENKVLIFADWQGRFVIPTNTTDDTLPVIFSAFGFIDERPVVDLTKDHSALRVIMKPKIIILPEVTVVSHATRTRCVLTGNVTAYRPVTKKDTAASFTRNVLDTLSPIKILVNPLSILVNPVKIYPNPALKKSIIHLSIKDIGNYQVQLFDNTSRLLHAEENTTTIKQQSIDLRLPTAMASGVYYIRLINMQTKKSYVEKLVVQ